MPAETLLTEGYISAAYDSMVAEYENKCDITTYNLLGNNTEQTIFDYVSNLKQYRTVKDQLKRKTFHARIARKRKAIQCQEESKRADRENSDETSNSTEIEETIYDYVTHLAEDGNEKAARISRKRKMIENRGESKRADRENGDETSNSTEIEDDRRNKELILALRTWCETMDKGSGKQQIQQGYTGTDGKFYKGFVLTCKRLYEGVLNHPRYTGCSDKGFSYAFLSRKIRQIHERVAEIRETKDNEGIVEGLQFLRNSEIKMETPLSDETTN